MADARKDEEETTIKVASSKDQTSGKDRRSLGGAIRLKRAAPKHSKSGNWKDGSIVDDERRQKANGVANPATSPILNPLGDEHREAFVSSRAIEDGPELQQCKHCKKSILRTAAKVHIAACLKIKKEKAQRKKEAREARERAKEAAREEEARKADVEGEARADDDSDDERADKKGPGKRAGKKADTTEGGKKRKAEGDPDKGPRPKKKKDEPKPKTAKPKGPVDVERQCGVILPNGQPCARSLTCKSHSMGAKRAVPGRSLPYDMLLAAYQKKNQAKQQKAAIDANAPLEDDDDPNGAAVDSDEETQAVMAALARWNPQPVVPQPVFAPIKRQYQLVRLHEQLQMATNGGRVNIFEVVGRGDMHRRPPAAAFPLTDADDAPGEPDVGPFSPAPAAQPAFAVPDSRAPVAGRA